jgi:hypothetical protein
VYSRRGYLWVVTVAVLAGIVAALVAWAAVGPYVPLFADRAPDGALHWPGPLAVVVTAAVSFVVLVLAATTRRFR